MKKNSFRSISNIKDHIPSQRSPVYNSYDNKLLSKFDGDNFADLVFDQCDSNGKPCWNKKHFLYQIEMLDYIPNPVKIHPCIIIRYIVKHFYLIKEMLFIPTRFTVTITLIKNKISKVITIKF